MKLASWNVNSVRARLETVKRALHEIKPDIVCLQEIKCVDEAFPYDAFSDLNYHISVHGQKSYNGVALLSKYPFEEVKTGFDENPDDEQARYLEALIVIDQQPVHISSLYVPNGNPCPGPKFDYKLNWLNTFYQHAEKLLGLEIPCILAGDYNIIPTEQDVYNAMDWQEDALFRKEIRSLYQALQWLGYQDAYSQKVNQPHHYTFWDYQGGAWPKNYGLRIDHILTSPQASDRLNSVTIHKQVRDYDKPSDHVPISADFNI